MTDFPRRLVFVDDEPDLRRIVREALEKDDPALVIVTCGGGEELLNRFRELQPDLILLDLKMKDMSGPDALEALRKREDGASVPVLFVTGAAKVEMTEEYKNLGVIGVLHKPFEAAKLREIIAGYWQAFIAEKIGD